MNHSAAVLSGGDAIAEALVANGVDTVFGLPGAQMYPFFDALGRRADRIRVIGARHEQACGYMAFGHARSTGRPGVFSVVPGPGVLNTTAALATALGACAPVLCVTGQIPSAFIGRGRGHLHEIPDQLATLRSLCKWAERIERPADAPAVMDEAFRQMLCGRPGPVAVEMAWDVMAAREEVAPLPAASLPSPPAPEPADIERAADILARARRPMIFVGSGAQGAAAEVRALAETLKAPVVALRGGRGVVPETDEWGLSSYAASLLWPEVDAALGIGTRLELPFMRWTGMMTLIDRPEAPPHIVRLDIDPDEMRRLVPHVGLVADAGEGARALRDALGRRHIRSGDAEALARVKAQAAQAIARVTPHVAHLAAVRAALPPEGFLVEELCQAGFASYFAYPVLQPRTYVSAGYQGTLGFGFPTALGVKAANPHAPVVSIAGDGGFLFAVQELATAAQEGLGVVAVVFNNGAYGNVMRDQETRYGGRVVAAALRNPDFSKLAEAFGVGFRRVSNPDELRAALPPMLQAKEPALIEVVVDRATEVDPWPLIHPKR